MNVESLLEFLSFGTRECFNFAVPKRPKHRETPHETPYKESRNALSSVLSRCASNCAGRGRSLVVPPREVNGTKEGPWSRAEGAKVPKGS